ncbi:hypothetical protein D3C71_1872440 [compost metagenome]
MFERARDPADGGDAHPGQVIDLAIRHALAQQRHHAPAVGHGFQLGGGAEVTQESLHVLRLVQRGQRACQRLQGSVGNLFTFGVDARLHLYQRISVLAR